MVLNKKRMRKDAKIPQVITALWGDLETKTLYTRRNIEEVVSKVYQRGSTIIMDLVSANILSEQFGKDDEGRETVFYELMPLNHSTAVESLHNARLRRGRRRKGGSSSRAVNVQLVKVPGHLRRIAGELEVIADRVEKSVEDYEGLHGLVEKLRAAMA